MVIVCLGVVGMGGVGDESLVRLPRSDRNFRVTVTDQSDVSMDLESFSWGGQTHLFGKRGRAEISVDFIKVARVRFFLEQNDVRAEIVLKDGQVLSITMDTGRPCYGRHPYGNVKIEVRDIKTLVFHGRSDNL